MKSQGIVADEFSSDNGDFTIEHQEPGWKWVEFWQDNVGRDSSLVEFEVALIPAVIKTLQEIYDRNA